MAQAFEYPPLLPHGFHTMSVAAIRALCVDATAFATSTTRHAVMNGLETFVARLQEHAIHGEVWVDGSFLTLCLDPADVDLLLRVQVDSYNNATPEQQETFTWVESNLKDTLKVDSYLWVEHPPTPEHAWDAEWGKAYWIRQFGFDRDDDPKGMALIPLPIQAAPIP